MEHHELKNYGEVYTGSASIEIQLKLFTSFPKELGILGTPKFLAKFPGKDREWKGRQFKVVEERGITSSEFVEGMQYTISLYTALLDIFNKNEADKHFSKITEKAGIMIWEHFLPTAEDFLRCPSPWEAFRKYFLEFHQAFDRANLVRFEVIQDTDSEFHIHCSDCAWDAVVREAGYPEALCIASAADDIVYSRLAQGIGVQWRREARLCCGNAFCDFHFYRHQAP